MIATTTRVVLVNASTQAIEWTGLLSEFFEANRETIDDSERLLVVKILSQGAVYHVGGGAGPLQWLKAIEAFIGDPKPADPPDIVAEERMEAGYYERGTGQFESVLALLGIVFLVIVGAALLRRADPQPVTVVEPAAPTGLIVLRDDAPAWCLDPDYPRGDMWYESCAEPRR